MDDLDLHLKVLVGSRAHGLADENSDYDYRGVYVTPTSTRLKLFHKPQDTHWCEGDKDNTLWELKHFLEMSVKSNPTILETYHAPIVRATELGYELRALFPKVWGKEELLQHHLGYARSQREKFLDRKDGRPYKYASAWLRVVYQAYSLLTEGTYPVDFSKTEIFETLQNIRKENFNRPDVIFVCELWEDRVRQAAEKYPDKYPDGDAINGFLLKVRKEHW